MPVYKVIGAAVRTCKREFVFLCDTEEEAKELGQKILSEIDLSKALGTTHIQVYTVQQIRE